MRLAYEIVGVIVVLALLFIGISKALQWAADRELQGKDQKRKGDKK